MTFAKPLHFLHSFHKGYCFTFNDWKLSLWPRRPANTKWSDESLMHQPTLVLPTSLWNPASTLHLYQLSGGRVQRVCCCCCCSEDCLRGPHILFTAFHSSHTHSALTHSFCPASLSLFHTQLFLLFHNNSLLLIFLICYNFFFLLNYSACQ
jgi:hypothetical protein